MTRPIRPEVVDELVRRFAGQPDDADAVIEHLTAGIRSQFGVETDDSPTEEEYRWAVQRVRGMTPQELADAAREPGARRLRLVDGAAGDGDGTDA